MQPVSYFSKTSQQVSKHPVGLVKLESTANTGATATLFVQIHDSSVVPAEGSVPVKSWPIAECGYKEFKKGELRLTQGLYVCLSSTRTTKTLAVGGSDLLDVLSLELFDPEKPTGTTIAGDETTAVASRTPWVTASGPKRLIEVVVNDSANALTTETTAAPVYLLGFARDAAPATEVYPVFSRLVKFGVRNVFQFGNDGFEMRHRQVGVDYIGCKLILSTTQLSSGTLTTGCPIKVEYK